MSLLQDKVCIITGGAGSIGLASAKRFLAEGARVMLVDLRQSDLDKAAKGLDASRVATCVADVTKSDQVKNFVAQTVARWGYIDVLFNNAGNFGTVAPIESYPEEVFEAVFQVHVKGAFLTCKHGVPHMRAGGSIIITSSVAGTRGDPGVYGYIPAKHAQIGLMKCLAKELAPRQIRVNCVNPGPVDNQFQSRVEEDLGRVIQRDATEFFNEIIPLGRHASADEVANAVLFLACAQSSFTTGSLLMVDGGMSA